MFKAIEDEVCAKFEECSAACKKYISDENITIDPELDLELCAEFVVSHFGEENGPIIAMPYLVSQDVTQTTTIDDLVKKHYKKEDWGDYFPDIWHLSVTLIAVEIFETLKGEVEK